MYVGDPTYDQDVDGDDPTVPASPGARDRDITTPTRGRDITGYDVGRELGRGGMGRVVAAHDRTLRRTVAIKRLHATTGEAAERFRREAELTARLQHPGIVPVYTRGEDADGAPFYAMRLVEGTTLATAIGDARTIEQRMALVPIVQQIADTIAYAHSQHVIHRDLKPNNVMLGAFGETLVVDWGIAKDLAADGVGGARMTEHGAVMGTPSYMAPEQAAGEDVDERADVYALGGILEHVLAGAQAPAALSAIVAKAKAELPQDRYPTAREFADDLRRFQTGQLVAAHRYTLGEHAARLVRRYRYVLLAIVAAIVTAGVVGGVMFARVLDARDAARTERDAAIVARARGELDRDPSRVEALVAGVDHADVPLLRASARASGVADVRALDVVPSSVATIDGKTWIGDEGGAITVDGARVAQLAGPVDGIAAMGERVVAWDDAQIVVLEGTRAGAPIACAGGLPLSVVAPPTGRAVCAGREGTELVELATGERRTLDRDLLALAQLDRTRIAARDGAGAVHAFDAATLAKIATLPPSADSPTALALAGDRVVIARGTEVIAWDPITGAVDPYTDVDAAAHVLAVSSDGARLAVHQLDGTLRIFDARSRRQLRRAAIGTDATLLGFAPHGDRIAVTVRDELHLLPVAVARRWRLLGHTAPIADITWGVHGPLSVARDKTLRAWRLDEPVAVAVDNAIVQPRAAFAPDGSRLLVWDLTSLREVTLPAGAVRVVERDVQVAAAAHAHDGAIIVAGFDGRIRRDGVELARVEPGPLLAITTTAAGDVIVYGGATKQRAAFVRAWDREGKAIAAPPSPAPPREVPTGLRARELDGVRHATWSGSTLAVVTRDHACIFSPARSLEGYCLPHDRVGEAWFSPDGRYLATSAPGEVLIFRR